jgi:uncharacterized phage protein (TIGR01671 family)
MREIKFRAKRIDMDRWIYGQYFTTPLTDENSGTTPDKGWFFLTGETRHCIVQNMVAFVIDLKTLGQYTGLKDINSKEIFDDDIVENEEGKRFRVRWGINSNGFIAQTRDVHSNVYSSYHLIPKTKWVGTFHENPEMWRLHNESSNDESFLVTSPNRPEVPDFDRGKRFA